MANPLDNLNKYAKDRYSASRFDDELEEDEESLGQEVYDEPAGPEAQGNMAGPYVNEAPAKEDELTSAVSDKLDEARGTKNDVEKVQVIDEARDEVPTEIEENLEVKQQTDEVEDKYSRFQEYLDMRNSRRDELVEAQEKDNDRADNALITRGARQIGSAFSGGKYDEGGLDEMGKPRHVKQANQRFAADDADKKEFDQEAFRDPDGEISIQIRDAYKKVTGKDLPDNVSAFQLQQAGINVMGLLGMNEKKLERQEKASERVNKEEVKKTKDIAKNKKDEIKQLRDQATRLGGFKRGGIMKEQWNSYNAIKGMEARLDSAIKGKTKLIKSDAVDLSAIWSKVLTGGVPAQTLIFETMPESLKAEAANAINWATGKPKANYYTKEMLQHIKGQLEIVRNVNNANIGDHISKGLATFKDVYNQDSNELRKIEKQFGDFIQFDKEGFATRKYDFDGSTYDASSHGEEVPTEDTKQETSGEKEIVKRMYSESRNKTKLIYSDGTEEIVDGKK
jgi:hypothetical protein